MTFMVNRRVIMECVTMVTKLARLKIISIAYDINLLLNMIFKISSMKIWVYAGFTLQ